MQLKQKGDCLHVETRGRNEIDSERDAAAGSAERRAGFRLTCNNSWGLPHGGVSAALSVTLVAIVCVAAPICQTISRQKNKNRQIVFGAVRPSRIFACFKSKCMQREGGGELPADGSSPVAVTIKAQRGVRATRGPSCLKSARVSIWRDFCSLAANEVIICEKQKPPKRQDVKKQNKKKAQAACGRHSFEKNPVPV